MDLEALGTKELAFHITLFDWDLFWAVHEYELLYHTFGRHHFGKVSHQHKTHNKHFKTAHEWGVKCSESLNCRNIKCVAVAFVENFTFFDVITNFIQNALVWTNEFYTFFLLTIGPARWHRRYEMWWDETIYDSHAHQNMNAKFACWMQVADVVKPQPETKQYSDSI